ncbi:peptidyl-prolyl cis-trans isomerase Cpr4p [Monosporozyma servazzii]
MFTFRGIIAVLCSLSWLVSIVVSAPTDGQEQTAPFKLDTNKVYPPDPPSSLNVFMGYKYIDKYTGEERVVDFTIALFDTLTPKATKNFQMLSSGFKVITDPKHPERVHDLAFTKTRVLKVIPGVQVEAGELFPGIPFCLYGQKFEDESFALKHDRPGRVSLVSTGPDTNESKFIIDLAADGSPEKDNVNVVFGQVVSGIEDLVDAMNRVEVDPETGNPKKNMIISYTVVDQLKIADLDVQHSQWEQDAKAFEEGDRSKGFQFKGKSYKARSDQELSDAAYAEFNHPLLKVIILFAILGAFYLGMKKKDQIMDYLPLTNQDTSSRSD